jgi:hypothetical protein
MREKRVMTPYRNTRAKLNMTFAKVNRLSLDGSPILTREDASAFPCIPDDDYLYFDFEGSC